MCAGGQLDNHDVHGIVFTLIDVPYDLEDTFLALNKFYNAFAGGILGQLHRCRILPKMGTSQSHVRCCIFGTHLLDTEQQQDNCRTWNFASRNGRSTRANYSNEILVLCFIQFFTLLVLHTLLLNCAFSFSSASTRSLFWVISLLDLMTLELEFLRVIVHTSREIPAQYLNWLS